MKNTTSRITPSLVINLASDCNMRCRYCPPGGENLLEIPENELANLESICDLLTIFRKNCNTDREAIVRITGGEPLLDKYNEKLEVIFAKLFELKYTKIVLGTNALNLNKFLMNKESNIHNIRESLLLKISMDSNEEEVFENLTRCPAKNLKKVRENIIIANNLGFRVGINGVVTNENVGNLDSLIEFAIENQLEELKLLSLSKFGDKINDEIYNSLCDINKINRHMEELISRLRKDKNLCEKNLFLNGDKGIQMKTFSNGTTTVKIVDHNMNQESITSTRTFAEVCKCCEYYRKDICSTGIMAITMRADGYLSYCRLKSEDQDNNISHKNFSEIEEIFQKNNNVFSYCFTN